MEENVEPVSNIFLASVKYRCMDTFVFLVKRLVTLFLIKFANVCYSMLNVNFKISYSVLRQISKYYL